MTDASFMPGTSVIMGVMPDAHRVTRRPDISGVCARPQCHRDGMAARPARPRYTGGVRRALGATLIVVALANCSAQQVVSGRDLIEAPDRFEGRPIVLTGIVQDPRKRLPNDGATCTTFTLVDGSARVPVAAPGTLPVSAGDLVEVRGTFHQQLRIGGDTLVDTVEAEFVRPLRPAMQPPGTPVGPP